MHEQRMYMQRVLNQKIKHDNSQTPDPLIMNLRGVRDYSLCKFLTIQATEMWRMRKRVKVHYETGCTCNYSHSTDTVSSNDV